MDRRDAAPVTNRDKLSDLAEVRLEAHQQLLLVLWCLYPDAFQALRRDVLPRYVDYLAETSYSFIKGPVMWLQAGRAGGLPPLVQLAGHHYLQKSLYPYGPGYLDTLFVNLQPVA